MCYLWPVVWSFPGLRACWWSVWSAGGKPSRSVSSRRTTALSKSIRRTFATCASNSKLLIIFSYIINSEVPTNFSDHFSMSSFLPGALNAVLILIPFTLFQKLGHTQCYPEALSTPVHTERALCRTLSAATVNSVAVDKWSPNFKETWHPRGRTIKQKYYWLCRPPCNRSQWPAVLHRRFALWTKTAYTLLSIHFYRFIAPLHFLKWNEDINLGLFPPI